jgi:hypothetical protein
VSYVERGYIVEEIEPLALGLARCTVYDEVHELGDLVYRTPRSARWTFAFRRRRTVLSTHTTYRNGHVTIKALGASDPGRPETGRDSIDPDASPDR